MGPALLRVKGLISLLEHAQGSAVVRGAEQLLHGLAWMPAWPSDDAAPASSFITLAPGRRRGGRAV
jgi:hypothetical protein